MSDPLNILVEAKREYIGQLCLLMCPVMIETYETMYEEAYKLSKGRKVLVMYQKLLKEVPNWSDALSKTHTDNITNRCAWFNDLLAAVFVSCVKILSAVRLNKENKKISHLALVKQSRLSVMPIDYKSWKIICNMGKI